MADVVCLGELLIDFTSLKPGASIVETPGFEKNAGGAPANVAVGVVRLGGSAAFLGMVGKDEFGIYLASMLSDRGVNTRGLRYSARAHTTLAFVALREDGEREFIFYRNPGADMLYSKDELDHDLISNCRIFHHGSISMISDANREATLEAIRLAKAGGALVSYDPNLRLNLWESAQAAREGILLGLPSADILKVSEEELEFITGQPDISAGVEMLRDGGIRAVVVTMGGAGCAYSWGSFEGSVATCKTAVVDATGAGDAFVAGVLYHLSKPHLEFDDLDEAQIRDILAFANSVAGVVVTRRGAIPAMPLLHEVAP